ncbi:MAG TPA: C4-type zinc ribbon domain-containing protein [Salinivirgaceae bacterium]|nr:C4-type zinc ribbon domain-containing protein [Salinivirgaceae bacterium]
MTTNEKKSAVVETVTEKLKNIYRLQCIDNAIFKIETMRGELPLEVQDLEDEVAGLETRINKIKSDIKALENEIAIKKTEIQNANAIISKYEEQRMTVRNNREYESIEKEIEYQRLEIMSYEKAINEFTAMIKKNKEILERTMAVLKGKNVDLEHKRADLNSIIAETKTEEDKLNQLREKVVLTIEERLYKAYTRIRNNSRNKLAVVTFDRNSCGGCFNLIPPQRMVEIRHHKKLIDCEYCGRILIDSETAEEIKAEIDAIIK